MKKFSALLLSLILVLMTFLPVTANAQTVCNCNELPIIYVRGRATILRDKSQPRNDETNPALPYLAPGKAEELIKELVPVYYKCYRSDDFEPFRVLFTQRMAEVYEDYALDNNGNVKNNSGLPDTDYWRNKNIIDNHKASTAVETPRQAHDEIYKYFFQYDCRLDPCDTADDLYDFIQKVKEVTGHDKIKIVGRCLGAGILSAYLAEYGWSDISDVLIYNTIMNGTAVNNSLFNGELYFDADAVDFFATQNLDDTAIFSLIKQIITLANKTYGLDMTMDYFNKTGTKVARLVVPDAMRVSYGTTPGYWSMVSAENYIEARDYIFAGVEDEFAGLIARLDNYYNTVSSKLNDMYKQMEADGVHIYNISKYGYQLYPIMEDADYQSDMIVTVEQQAPGTTCAPIGSKFDDAYIAAAEEKGTAKYISPDRQIDASTSLFPDTTWYIKNIEHNNFPVVIDELIYRIMRFSSGRMTVWDNSRFPQYLIYAGEENNKDSIRPMSETDQGYSIEEPSFFDLLHNLTKSVIVCLGELFNVIVERIKAN